MLSAEDRLSILDLYARYNVLVDSRDEAWAEIFTPDGVFSARGRVFKGTEELRGYVRNLIAGEDKATHADTQHWNANITLAEDGDEVRGSCYLLRVGRNKATGALEVVTLGRYADRLVRQGDGWAFAERVVTLA